MEFVKNIFFNTDKIVENSNVKISYAGYLFQNGSEEVYLHYGFGDNWNQVTDLKMEKTELGFQCEIAIPETNCLKLCFHNNVGVWDNCFGNNFSFSVEKVIPIQEKVEELSLIPKEDMGMQVHKGLRKSYLLSKKIRLAIYKIIHYVPKLISGNFKKVAEDK